MINSPGRLETHPAVFSQLSCVILTACRVSPSATGLEISLPPAPARSRSSRVAARCHQAPASYVAPAFDAGRPELVRLYAVVRGSYAFRTPFVRAWYALEVVRFAFGRTLKGRMKGSTVKVQLKYGFYGTAPSV